jgi:aryl-alcohol dehydrogenase-like predicted oxidoreductase
LSAPEIALEFALQYPRVASTFVGFSSVAEVRDNLIALHRQPDPDLLREITEVVAPVQGVMWVSGFQWNH